jgi:hypothetical protein
VGGRVICVQIGLGGTGKGVDERMSTPLRDLVEWAEVVDEALKEELKGSKR